MFDDCKSRTISSPASDLQSEVDLFVNFLQIDVIINPFIIKSYFYIDNIDKLITRPAIEL